MDRSRTIRLTEQELYEICHGIIGGENFQINKFSAPKNVAVEVERNFKLLYSMEKPRSTSWFSKHTNNLIFFALISFVALSGKMIIENFLGNH